MVGGLFTNISGLNKPFFAVYDLDEITAVDELSDLAVSIFPNPVSHEINIDFSTDKIYYLELYASNGALIKNETINGSNNHILNVENLSNGV